jgi:hypothetical protein
MLKNKFSAGCLAFLLMAAAIAGWFWFAPSVAADDGPVYYDQSFDLCYTGCAAWRLYWSGDAVWRYVESYCSMDGKGAAKTLVKYAFNTIRGSADFGPLIQSLYCAGIIKLNIQPRLEQCRQACQADMWAYAPDLFVKHGPGGTVYFPDKHQLQIKVYNGGYVYSPAFKVDVYAASTDDRACQIEPDDWEKIDSYTIDELAPFDVNRNSLNIPSQHTHTLDWQAPADKCSQIKVIVDPDNRIPELGEAVTSLGNNQYILTVNNLPALPHYQISDIQHSFLDDNLDDVVLSFKIKNTGEMTGRPKIEVKDCYGNRTLRGVKTSLSLSGGDSQQLQLTLKDLFWPDEPVSFRNRCLEIDAIDENGTAWNRDWLTIFSASVSGRVLDMTGRPVANATVALSDGSYVVSDEKGYYELSSLTKYGHFTLTASHPEHDQQAEREIEFKLSPDPRDLIQSGLHLYNVDLILFDQPAKLIINCPTTDYSFRLNGQYFSYQGNGESAAQALSALVPGDYQLVLAKPGYSTQTLNITLQKGQTTNIDCNLQQLSAYLDDGGIYFKPRLNDLWTFRPAGDFHPTAAAISPDGSTVFISLADTHSQQVKLLVFNQSGKKLAEANIPGKAAYEPVYLESTYDGSRVLVDAYLVFDRQGNLVGQRGKNEGRGVQANLSWNGNLVCADKGLYNAVFEPLYTGVWSPELDTPHTQCRFGQFATFTADGQIISRCKKPDGGLCRLSFWDSSQYPLLNLSADNYWRVSVTPDNRRLVVAAGVDGQDQVLYLDNGKVSWHRPILSIASRLSISPAGGYTVVLEPHGKEFALRVFDRQGKELFGAAQGGYNFYDAKATGQGIFFVRYDGQVHFGVLGEKSEADKQNLADNFSNHKKSGSGQVENNHQLEQDHGNYHAQASHQTVSLLGRLWQSVKNFFHKIFSWIF